MSDPNFKLKELTHIYIIESPSQQDIIDGISEGHASINSIITTTLITA